MELQLFSGDRTEQATPRRLKQARDEGRAPRSTDLISGLGLVAATMALKALGPAMYQLLTTAMKGSFASLNGTELTPDQGGTILQGWAMIFLKAFFPLTVTILVVGVVAGLLQSGLLFSWNKLSPDFQRINPFSGLARIFSLNGLVEQSKGLLKLGLVGLIAYRDMRDAFPALLNLTGQTTAMGASMIAERAIAALQRIGYGLLVLGMLDYGYQYWSFLKSVRMTKQEVKQEHKEQEGSPEVRQKRRSQQRELARRRKALKEVPRADVVVTNPTHFAVAIQYQADRDAAPRVVAKGADLLAQRIKVLARRHEVPLVENRHLARTLYATVDVGEKVPPEMYQAVAEVLAFVFGVRRQQRQQKPSEI